MEAFYTEDEIKKLYKKRKCDANKGDFGRILCIAGSYEMVGAAYFCARGAVESGAGLVCCAFPDKAYAGIASKLNEPLMLPLKSNENGRISFDDINRIEEKLKWAEVVAIGCGMGVDGDTVKICEYVVKNCKSVLVIDADGINCISRNIDILKEAECDIVLTPHPGEMSRLTGKSISEIQSNRVKSAVDFAVKYSVTLCLKGANTVVAHKDGRFYVNTTGNPGMARGGMGDVLTGITAGLIPQTGDTFTGTVAAVYEHGKAGDFIFERYGSYCKVTPSRVLDSLSISFN